MTQFNEFLLIHTHQDLLYMSQKNYFLNKWHETWAHFDNISGF